MRPSRWCQRSSPAPWSELRTRPRRRRRRTSSTACSSICKNTADLSNLNTRVEEIATRVTTNELVLVNTTRWKKAMTRAIQVLVLTGFVSWLLVDSWALLATKKIRIIIAGHIAAPVFAFLTSRADQVSAARERASLAWQTVPEQDDICQATTKIGHSEGISIFS